MSKIKFLKSHEWYNPESNTVGISDFAQRELGDIVFVELPQVGESVEAGEAFGNVESVKAVSEIYSPVSGTIMRSLRSSESAPGLINQMRTPAWIF